MNAFLSSYQWRVRNPQTTTGRSPQYVFPAPDDAPRKEKVVLEVEPENGPSWVGMFDCGPGHVGKLTGVFPTPNSDRVFVVARGAGAFVSVTRPNLWERIAEVTDVRVVPTARLLILAKMDRLVAYGPTGLKWRSQPLVWNQLTIRSVTGDAILCEGYDLKTDSMTSVTVDLKTGRHTGGSDL